MYCYYYYSPPPPPSGGGVSVPQRQQGRKRSHPERSHGRSDAGVAKRKRSSGAERGRSFRSVASARTETEPWAGSFFLRLMITSTVVSPSRVVFFFPPYYIFFMLGIISCPGLEKKTLNKRKKNTTVPEQNNFLEVPNARKKT